MFYIKLLNKIFVTDLERKYRFKSDCFKVVYYNKQKAI